MKSPKWLEQVIGSVCAACINDVKGRMSGLSYRWSKPEDNSWGTRLLMIAPAVVEIAGGKDDGATGFDFTAGRSCRPPLFSSQGIAGQTLATISIKPCFPCRFRRAPFDEWVEARNRQEERKAMQITVETTVAAPVEEVWRAWTTPEDIKQWNAASDDWHTTAAAVDLRVGGQFSSRMEAKDGSRGFDFAGTYTKVVPHQLIECTFGGRTLSVQFIKAGDRVTVRETFDAEETHTPEQQRAGWQAILDRFARQVEGRTS